MNTKQKIRLLLFASFFVSVATLGTCYGGFESLCGPGVNENLAIFLILFSSVILFLSFVCLFISQQVFTSWLHFAKYYLPIAAILIILSPTVDSSILGFDKEFMTWLFAGVFFVVSSILIIYKSLKLRAR